MITILARKHIRNDAQGNDIARVYISVSTASELPAQDAIPNIIIAEGSKAWDISTGDEYGFIVGQGWNKQAGGGVSDYEELENLPQINSVTLIGNKSLSDLGIVNPMMLMGRVDTVADLQNIPNPQTGWLYLVGLVSEAQKAEYVYTANDTWELMGYNTIVIDSALSTTSENPVQNKVITNALDGKVNTETGKGLSTNDYTTAEKDKLAALSNYDDTEVRGLIATKADASILTPISESAYEALTTKDKPLYFIYD